MNVSQAVQILDLPMEFSQEDTKKAYRRKALLTHPDKGGTVEAFKLVQEAYELLSNTRAKMPVFKGSEIQWQVGRIYIRNLYKNLNCRCVTNIELGDLFKYNSDDTVSKV